MDKETRNPGIEKTPMEKNQTGADKKDNRDGKDETIEPRKDVSERENEAPNEADPAPGDYRRTDPKLERHPNDR